MKKLLLLFTLILLSGFTTCNATTQITYSPTGAARYVQVGAGPRTTARRYYANYSEMKRRAAVPHSSRRPIYHPSNLPIANATQQHNEISRLDKNYKPTVQRATTCYGINYYGANSPCRN